MCTKFYLSVTHSAVIYERYCVSQKKPVVFISLILCLGRFPLSIVYMNVNAQHNWSKIAWTAESIHEKRIFQMTFWTNAHSHKNEENETKSTDIDSLQYLQKCQRFFLNFLPAAMKITRIHIWKQNEVRGTSVTKKNARKKRINKIKVNVNEMQRSQRSCNQTNVLLPVTEELKKRI